MGLTKQQITMVAVLMAGAFLAVLNQTLLTPALPTIMSHLSVSATTVQWLTSGYSLVEAVIIPLNAYLLGRFPTRKLFVGGIALFAAGSALCACAPTFAFLFLGRICQASATGILMPTVFSLILLIFPRESRGSAMGMIGIIIGFAPAIGPSISGVLVDTIGWRALFVLVTFLAVLVVITSALWLKNFEGFDRTTFDAPSVALLAVGMVGLLYGLSTFTSSDRPLASVLLMAAGAAVLALFAHRQTRLENPVLRIQVLRHREFRVATLVIILLEALLIGSSVLLPLFIQNALGQSPTASGLMMLPGALGGAVCGLVAGRLFDRFGVRGITAVGSLVLVAGVAGYFSLTADASVLAVCLVYTVACAGMQFLITPLNTWGLNSLPNSSIPHGNAIVSTMEQVGSSLGTAFVVSLTALSFLLVPADASAAEQTFAGCHIAFLGVFAIAVAIAVLIVLFVKDKGETVVGVKDTGTEALGANTGETKAPNANAGSAAGCLPGVDRPWLVADVMNAQPDALGADSTVRDAISIMQRTETSGLPIVREDGNVAGFISDGDILKRLAHHKTSRETSEAFLVLLEAEPMQDRLAAILDESALKLATKNVITVNADTIAEDAFKTLSEKRIKKVPVLQNGRFVGTLSRRNIMKALTIMEGPVTDRH